jgi:tRNA wybutosine-synthesizing protein 1
MAGGIVVHNCWRHGKNPVAREWKWQMDQPEFLIEQSIIKHQNMIRECKGVPGVIPERLVEAMTVRHCALSLVGEPIIYPQINRFVDLLHERKISSFMVTNAQFPKELEMLKPVTQVYLSIDAATRESLKAVDRPVHPDFWERFLASIDVLRNKKQRTVFRLTLVKEWNMNEMRDYAQLIERGMPEFIEVKGVTYCGNNKTSSLTIKNTPYHEEVCAFVQQLADEANKLVGEGTYRLCAAHEHSVCFLLAHKKFFIDNAWHTFIDYERFHVLVQSGKPFESLDYVAKTPSWALFGSAEKGFDPEETRVFRKGKEGKRDLMYATSGC